jgi:hypothetical protein
MTNASRIADHPANRVTELLPIDNAALLTAE